VRGQKGVGSHLVVGLVAGRHVLTVGVDTGSGGVFVSSCGGAIGVGISASPVSCAPPAPVASAAPTFAAVPTAQGFVCTAVFGATRHLT